MEHGRRRRCHSSFKRVVIRHGLTPLTPSNKHRVCEVTGLNPCDFAACFAALGQTTVKMSHIGEDARLPFFLPFSATRYQLALIVEKK